MKLDGRWSWIELVLSPEYVSQEHVLTAYALDKAVCEPGKCKANCRTNPFCLNGLGEQRWLKKSIDEEEAGNEPEEELEKKEKDESNNTNTGLSGLKNYGNTCYLNALLQIYFRLVELRQAVYNLPLEVDDADIFHQLQIIFAQLQIGITDTVDPGGLIEALALAQSEQQDAPEFHSLFLNLLESRFMLVDNPVLQNLVKGDCYYETKCLHCGNVSQRDSSFQELDLKLSSNDFYHCIEDFLKVESLTGDNQYACYRCGVKRDGERRTVLSRLPPLLCFQLLRFTYDIKAGRKKKHKDSVRIPEILDMEKFLPPLQMPGAASNGHPRANYVLKGVLLHLGPEPYSGHYIAVTRDYTLDWTVCNDNTVYTVPAASFKLAKVGVTGGPSSGSSGAGNTKKVRSDNGVTPSGGEDSATNASLAKSWNPQWNRVHHSATAYMLFYEREDQFVERMASGYEVDISPHLVEAVEAANSALKLEMAEKELHEAESQARKRARREEMREMIEKLRLNGAGTSQVEMLPTDWLMAWLRKPDLVPAIKWLPKALCPHDLLSPDINSGAFRVVRKDAVDLLNDSVYITRRMDTSSLCTPCVRWKCALLQFDKRCGQLTKEIDQIMRQTKLPPEDQYWIGKETFRQWKKMSRKEMTRRYASFPVEVSEEADTEVMQSDTNDDQGDSKNETGASDSDEEELRFNQDLLCEHGNLCADPTKRRIVSSRVWKLLAPLFAAPPTFQCAPVPEEELGCPECSKTRLDYTAQARVEREMLGDLFMNKRRPRVNQPADVSVENGGKVRCGEKRGGGALQDEVKPEEGPFYLLPGNFLSDWRRFLRQPTQDNLPEVINTNEVLCQHGMVSNTHEELVATSSVLLIWPKEWRFLSQRYPLKGPALKVTWSEAFSDWLTEPGLCNVCYTKTMHQKAQFKDARISIHLLNPDGIIGGGAPPPKRDCMDTNLSAGVRRSVRQRRHPGDRSVRLSSDWTVRDLKVHLMNLYSVTPMDQHLIHKDRELYELERTIQEEGIRPGDVLNLWTDTAVEAQDDVMASSSTSQDTVELGFKGTKLLGS